MLTEPAIKPPLATGKVAPAPSGPAVPTLVWWLLGGLILIAISLVIVLASGMRPGYDAFGWMVWGRQVLHWNLNTDGAPSWKPLTFLFTLPYALAGRGQVWLWMVTAVAGALAGAVFAARIAYRLTGPCPQRAYAPCLAGMFAAAAVLGLDGYSHEILIATADPLVVTLCLAAIDCHLCRRERLAFATLVLASLGRPEAWPFVGLYALWAWRARPSMRWMTVGGIALIPAAWFTIPALTSKDWFISGDLALHSVNAVNVIHGNKIGAVLNRTRELSGWPLWIAAFVGLLIAAVRRDIVTLALAAAACLWVAVEIGLALHGWSAAPRYLFEPAAVMAVIAASAVGRVLAFTPRAVRNRPTLPWATAAASLAAVVVLAVTLIPTARHRVTSVRADLASARLAGRQIVRLQEVIDKLGGPAKIRSCGQPVTLVGLQSKVAWATDLNVGDVGYKPGRSIRRGTPIVYFKPHRGGWRVLPIHMRARDATRCARLRTDSG